MCSAELSGLILKGTVTILARMSFTSSFSKPWPDVHLVGLLGIFLGMDEEEVVGVPGHEDIFFGLLTGQAFALWR